MSTHKLSASFYFSWICINIQKEGYFINLFWIYGWYKNTATWLAENILAQNLGTRISPNMSFVKKHSQSINFHYRTNSEKPNDQIFSFIISKNPVAHFEVKKIEKTTTKTRTKNTKKIRLCHAQLHMGFQHHSKKMDKTNDLIPIKRPDRQTDRRMDRKTPFLPTGIQ